MMRYTVILVPQGESVGAVVPAMPGCASQGRTREEAIANSRDAMEGWMDVEAEQGRTPINETADLIIRSVADAIDLIDTMRSEGEPAPESGYDLELASVQVREWVRA